MNHVFAGGAGDGVVLAKVDGLLGADFLTHAAVDTADHVDVEFLGSFFDFGPFVITGDFAGDDFDGLGRADEFAELAGDAAFAVLFVGDEGGDAAVMLGEVVIPLLLGVLHGDAET